MEPRLYALQRIKPGAERRLRSRERQYHRHRRNRLVWRDRRCERWRCHPLRDQLPKRRSSPDLSLWNHRYPVDDQDDKSGHNVYAVGYRSNRFPFQGRVVGAVDSKWLGRDHQRSIWAHHLHFGYGMPPWHNYDAADGGLDAKQFVHIERDFAANRGRGTVYVL